MKADGGAVSDGVADGATPDGADDETILDDVQLFRLVHPHLGIDWDEDEERWIVRSSAFQNSSKPVKSTRMSVVLEDTLLADGRSVEDARRTKPNWYLVAVSAGFAREEEQGVERDPREDEPAHGNVVGDKNKARQRRFAQAAQWVIEPPDPR